MKLKKLLTLLTMALALSVGCAVAACSPAESSSSSSAKPSSSSSTSTSTTSTPGSSATPDSGTPDSGTPDQGNPGGPNEGNQGDESGNNQGGESGDQGGNQGGESGDQGDQGGPNEGDQNPGEGGDMGGGNEAMYISAIEGFSEGAATFTCTLSSNHGDFTLTATKAATATAGSAVSYTLSGEGGMGESITGTLELKADKTVSGSIVGFGPFADCTISGTWSATGITFAS